MSDWITDNRGEGPWDFEAQKDKLGYVNNPNWTPAPASLIEHEPCGYWFKGTTPNIPVTVGPMWGAGTNEYGQLGLQSEVAWGPPYLAPDFRWVTVYPCYWDFREIPNAKWSRVSMGGGFSMSLRDNGTIWGAGANNFGQLGLGDLVTRHPAVQIGTGTDWVYVTCGATSSWALKSNGTLWSTGYNLEGDLGLGDFINRNVFTQVAGTGWAQVKAGNGHTVALKSDGTLWTCGKNAQGQLGNGTTGGFQMFPTFVQVGGATDWVKVAAGNNFTYALNSGGFLFATGYNGTGYAGLVYGGQLATGDTLDKNLLTLCTGGGNNWSDVKCGPQYTIAIKSNNTAWVTGENLYGEMGLGDVGPPTIENQYSKRTFTQIPGLPTFKSIQPGFFHAMLIGTDNSLWATGHNAYGECGSDPGGAHTDQFVGRKPVYERVGTENNWLKLWESGWFPSSVVIRAPSGTSIAGVPVARPGAVWTMPTT